MSHTAIWIDHHKATIFTFTANGIEEKSIEAAEKKLDKEHQKKFYHQVATALGGAEKIVVLGPGMAKDEFKNHCENHNHKRIFNAIVGIETMKDHPTKAELMKKADTFFSKYFQWNGLA